MSRVVALLQMLSLAVVVLGCEARSITKVKNLGGRIDVDKAGTEDVDVCLDGTRVTDADLGRPQRVEETPIPQPGRHCGE